MKTLLIITMILLALRTYGQCPPGTWCPPDGRDKNCMPLTNSKDRALNIWKNYSVNIPARAANFWDIEHLLGFSNLEDEYFYKNGDYVYTEGYVIDAKEQGPESCNCHMASKSQKNGDYHIFLGAKRNVPKSKTVVVEITPKFKSRYPQYQNMVMPGTKVRVWGYRVYDHEHRGNAAMTCMSCGAVWRKTNWEIHPIVYIERI